MGFFTDLFSGASHNSHHKKQKTREIGPRPPAKERAEREQLRYLNKLQKTDPDAYDAFMRRKLGIPAVSSSQPIDRLRDFQETAEVLKEIGVLNNIREDLADDNESIVVEGIKQLPALIAALRGGQQMANPGTATQPPPEPTRQIAPPSEPHQEAQMSIISNYVIGQLDGKQPQDAAQWLTSLPYPQATELIKAFRETEDGQILVMLSELASKYPDFRGLVEWLRQRPQWTVETIQALRRLGPAPVQQAAHGL